MRKGYTLFETLIVTLIFTVAFAAIIVLFARINRGVSFWSATIDLQEEARRAMDAMVRELRSASSVTITGGTQLTFNTPTVNSVRYYRCSATNRIKRCVNEDCCSNANGSVLANYASDLDFCWSHSDGTCCAANKTACGTGCLATCSGSSLLQISITTSETVRETPLTTFTLTEKVKTRNE